MSDKRMALVPREVTEDSADAIECAYSTEDQWRDALDAAPHGGKVSRERWEAAVEAVVRERYAFKGGEHIARAVITALGLEIEE